MYLGDKQQSEAIRFHLTLDAAPTGTPQVAVEKQGAAILAATNMIQDASTLDWYYAFTTDAGATIGAYQVKYSAVIDGVTRFAHDSYDVSIYSTDHVKAETASIQTDTTSIESKVDLVQVDTTAIIVDTTAIEIDTTSIETKVDIAIVDIAAVPTVGEIDTELTTEHGAGDWTSTGGGTGAYAIIFNIKDGSANNLEGVNVSVYNSADDDAPQYAIGQTDTDGNTDSFNLDAATYSVRLSKAGAIVSETETAVVSASATKALTVVAVTASNPTDPDVCRLRIYPITLGNADITNLADNLKISSYEALTKVEGQFISNTSSTFTYDAATDPDSYYFDTVRTSVVHITCDLLGIDTDVTVPDLATKDLTDLIS